MRRLLLLSYFFPPSSEVAAKPTARLVRHLPTHGWSVVVLAPEAASYVHQDPLGYADVLRTTTVERVSSWPHPTELLAHVKVRISRLRGRAIDRYALMKESELARARSVTGKPGALRSFLRSALCFPDPYAGWIMPASQRGVDLARTRRFDAMLSVSPAISAHLAALLIRRRMPGLPWVAQFHDPWANNPYSPMPTSLERATAGLERRVIQGSDAAALATQEAVALYRARYGGGRRFFALENGFDPTDMPPIEPGDSADSRTTFTYAGSLYGQRDPFPFLEALSRLVSDGRIDLGSLRVRFIGDCETAGGRSVRDASRGLGLGRVVEVDGPVPYPQALGALQQSDVLLLFAEGQPAQIPAKLFDYLPMRRPVLAFASGASARLVEETGVGVVASSNDLTSIEDAILRLIGRRAPWPRAPEEDVQQYSANRLAGKLAAELDRISALGRAGPSTAT